MSTAVASRMHHLVTMINAKSVTAMVGACVLAMVAGCSTETEGPADDTAAPAEEGEGAVESSQQEIFGICPAANKVGNAQQIAHSIAVNLIGGPAVDWPAVPFWNLPRMTACVAAQTWLAAAKAFFYFGENTVCQLQAPTETTLVCGREAAEYKFVCPLYGMGAAWAGAQITSTAIDICFGAPVGAFLHTNTFNVIDGAFGTLVVDPEPVRLTQALNGSTGATGASAVYTNSGTAAAKVRKVPLEATTYYSNIPVPGTPCSPVDLAPGQVTNRSVVPVNGSANRRKCY